MAAFSIRPPLPVVNNPRPRPPSGWHDLSRRRGREHDRIQAELLDFLRSRPLAALPNGAFVDRLVEGEFPLQRRGQVVAFVDAVEIVAVNLFRTASFFEVKPKIYTVSGVVRQIKATLDLARAAVPAEMHVGHIVAPVGDPLMAELRAAWPHTWAWGFETPEDDA